jgi:hypothetical protein
MGEAMAISYKIEDSGPVDALTSKDRYIQAIFPDGSRCCLRRVLSSIECSSAIAPAFFDNWNEHFVAEFYTQLYKAIAEKEEAKKPLEVIAASDTLPAKMTKEEWNNVYFPLCEVLPRVLRGSLMIGQTMRGDVMYKGKRYHVSGWAIGDKESVTANPVKD